jgi:predicted ATPase/DNA-binding SARP family transcriptional activator
MSEARVGRTEFGILGPLSVQQDGRPVRVAGRRRRALLLRLLADAGRAVPTELIAEDIWQASPPPGWASTLSSHASLLRGILGEGRLVGADGGYLLVVEPDELDAWLFEAEFEDSRKAANDADHRGARDLLRSALARWRGVPLIDAGGAPWALTHQARLGELRLAALESLVEALLAGDEPEEAVALAEASVADHPLRERLWAQLMVGLYRTGRQADALRSFQRVREILGSELGLNPGPDLVEIEQKILSNDPTIGRPSEGVPRPAMGDRGVAGGRPRATVTGSSHQSGPRRHSVEAQAHNLPTQLTEFIGRHRELTAGAGLLARSRLVTITGSGGCGKTRLGLALAERAAGDYPAGIWFVPFEVAEEPDQVTSVLARHVGLGELGGLDAASVVAAVADVAADSNMLLILDNCEHLADHVAQLVESLLAESQSLRILATSREPLAVSGEVVWPIQPLQLPPDSVTSLGVEDILRAESAQLFVARAQAAWPLLELDDGTVPLIAEVCRGLDGIPLAIELAAGMVGTVPLLEIAQNVQTQLRLTTDRRHVVERQRTLGATIDWSFRRLDQAEQHLLTRLAVFNGGFTLDAANALAGEVTADAVAPMLRRLVQKSVVAAEGDARGIHRYRLLAAIRQFAVLRLAGEDALDDARRAHAQYFMGLAEQADRNVHGPEAAVWLARVALELPNLRTALTYSLTDGSVATGARLAGALRWFLGRLANFDEAAVWIDRVVARRSELALPLQVFVLTAAATLAFSRGDFSITADVGEVAVALARTLDNPQELATALSVRGGAAVYEGNFDRAGECFEEAAPLCRRLGDRWGLGWLLTSWGLMARRMGQLDLAQERLAEALATFNAMGDTHGAILPTLHLGLVAQAAGDLEEAAARCGQALELASQIGDRQYVHIVTTSLARIHIDIGDLDLGRELALSAVREFHGVEHHLMVAIAFEGLAIVAGRLGKHSAAVGIWSYAAELRQRYHIPLTAERQRERERCIDECRAVIGADTFTEAWAAGQNLNHAVALSLAEEATAPAELASAMSERRPEHGLD